MTKKHIFLFALLALTAFSAFGQATPVAGAPGAAYVKWGVIGAAFVLGISAAAGAMGQAKAIAAAVEGIARNPSAAGPIRLAMIIGLALIESLVIYALVIAFVIQAK